MIADQPTPGLPLTINFNIPAYWTPEQALAVFELLDDLRDKISAHYSIQLFELSREQHLRAQTDRADSKIDDQYHSEPHNLKKRTPSGALSYPNDPSPHSVWFFTAGNR
jgi:hypothetical protein